MWLKITTKKGKYQNTNWGAEHLNSGLLIKNHIHASNGRDTQHLIQTITSSLLWRIKTKLPQHSTVHSLFPWIFWPKKDRVSDECFQNVHNQNLFAHVFCFIISNPFRSEFGSQQIYLNKIDLLLIMPLKIVSTLDSVTLNLF